MKEKLRERLRVLTQLHGISGCEENVARYVKDELIKVCDSVSVDPSGNVVGVKKGKKEGPSLMLIAHMDEVGMLVKNILPNGFILFNKSSLQPDKVLEGRKVIIDGKYIGVIGIKPGHLTKMDEGMKVKTAAECYIDLCCNSREEVEALGIEIGTPIVPQSHFDEMPNRDYICTKAIDDRINIAVMLEVMHAIKEGDFAGTVIAVASVQEETGLKGAKMVCQNVKADYSIVLDTVPSGDTPDVDTVRDLPICLGLGPACVLADGVWMSVKISFANKKIVKAIKEAGKKLDINIQTTTLLGDFYMTDQYEVSSAGIPCAGLSVPRRYSHSPVEVVNLNDAVSSVKILNQIIDNNENVDLSFI